MLENNRHLLVFCVVCGAIGAYLISAYVLLVALFVCAYLLFLDFNILGQSFTSATKAISSTVSSWTKTVITALMNSYHLSKPLEPEPSARRGSPFPANVPIPRRPSCRGGRYTCLDENTDYVNRRNGLGVCNANSTFKNSFSSNLRDFRRRNSFSERDTSPKIEEFSTPQTSPWTRRQNYSGGDYSSVRRVQTVAGPLLATSALTKRKSNDFGLFVDASSPGLASRIVQYREEGSSPGSSVWTHQPQYSSPGQFPMVHLSQSPSSLPVLSPHNSQKASRRSVRVKIAPPDPLGSRLFPLSTKNNTTYTTSVQADHSTKSVIETLKEISRKRIHSQLEDNDDDAVKRQKRSGLPDVLVAQISDVAGDGENFSKRVREDSPRQQELSPPTRPAKRIRNNEILSSLSSSRSLLQGGGVKRKTQSLDWSRCSTPVLGKQQKTTVEDSFPTPAAVLGAVLPVNQVAQSQPVQVEGLGKNIQKTGKVVSENEKNTVSSPSIHTPIQGRHTSKVTPKVTSAPAQASKASSGPLTDTPWQKDSPFVSVSSPDDIIDDVTALEEKREQDRKSRLMSMMTVISGGEPPVKTPETTALSSNSLKPPVQTLNSGQSLFSPDEGALKSTPNVSGVALSTPSEKTLFAAPSLLGSWGAKAASPTDVPAIASLSALSPSSVAGTAPTAPTAPTASAPTAGDAPSVVPATSKSLFSMGDSSQNVETSAATSVAFTTVSTAANSLPIVTSVFGSPALQVSTLSTTPTTSLPVFGSAASLFGSKPATSTEQGSAFKPPTQPVESTNTHVPTAGNISFGFSPVSSSPVTFGSPAATTAQNNLGAAMAASSTPLAATSAATLNTSMAATSAVSASAASLFQLRPAVSGLNQDSTSPSPSTAALPASAGQPSLFTKTIMFGASEKQSEGSQQSVPTTAATSAVLFGAPSTTAVTNAHFAFATPAAPATSVPQMKSGMFSFGGSSVTSPTSQVTSQVMNNKPVFGSAAGVFGQPSLGPELPISSTVSTQPVSAQAAPSRIGGFKFDLVPGKSLFGSAANPGSGPSTSLFGNTASTPAGAADSEPKSFTFGSGKPEQNPFASNAINNNIGMGASQAQPTLNTFGSPAVLQKPADANVTKESLFSFGGGSSASTFANPQQSVFSAQPTTATTTVAVAASVATAVASTAAGGFSFPTASPAFSSQPSAATGGFQMQAAAVPTAGFAAPATTGGLGFSFGAAAAPAPAVQSNPFAFGASPSTQPEAQPSGIFGFGGGGSVPPTASGGLFSQPAAQPAAPQPQSAPAPAFQFGTPSNPQQFTGTFSFGAPSNANNAPGGFPGAASTPAAAPAPSAAPGAYPGSTGGFGTGPSMFSIGTGSTAPRVRSSRSRRTK